MNKFFIYILFVLNILIIRSVYSFPSEKTTEKNSKRLKAELKSTISETKTQYSSDISTTIKCYPIAEFDYEHVKIPFVISIWILCSCIFKILYNMTPKLSKFLPESCMLIVMGLVIGILLRFGLNVGLTPLTSAIFFLYILPPIIFDAGYFMPNRMFFDNLGTILLMAVVGTIFNVFAIGCTLWAFGLTGLYGTAAETPNLPATLLFTAVIAATDPVAVIAVFEELHVNELLYIIVFGESLLNDAVTVVIYHVMEVYNNIGIENVLPQDIFSGFISFFVVALGGTFIGIIWGFLTGLVTRFTHYVLIVEPLFIFIMAYICYLNAEMFHLSGILAITFCGLTMKSYVESNVSKNSSITIRHALKMISNSAETGVFILLGVATIQAQHVWNTWFVILSVLSCTIFRIISVIVLIAISNRFRLHKLKISDQTIMSFGGLRGAVSFALVLLIDENTIQQRNMFLTTTIVIIFFTVFLQGITVKPILKWLNIKLMEKHQLTMNERIGLRFLDHLMAGFEDIVGNNGNYNVRAKFRRFNQRFIEPFLLRDVKKSERKFTETYAEVMLKDALELLTWSNVEHLIKDNEAFQHSQIEVHENPLRLCSFLKNNTKLQQNSASGRANFGFTSEEEQTSEAEKSRNLKTTETKSSTRKRLNSI